MRTLIALALVAGLSAPANAAPFGARVDAFLSAAREKPTEFNCRPAACHARAARLGLTWRESDWRICDKASPGRCAYPKF